MQSTQGIVGIKTQKGFLGRIPLELMVLIYCVSWIPYVALTRSIATVPHGMMARPLAGLEILPVILIIVTVLTYLFIAVSGWSRVAHRRRILGMNLPFPTKHTFWGAIGATLLIITVPLSFTFPGVSIPFVQLLMRGDVMLIAPIVDYSVGRKVRWYSWVALVIVLGALVLNFQARGGLHVPLLCIGTIVVYILGYFIRLRMMSKASKNDDPNSLRAYYVEEQLFANPLAVVIMAVLAFVGHGRQFEQLRWGFTHAWSQSVVGWLTVSAVLTTALGIMAALILLDKRENTFCVPFERSASVLGGIIAAYALAAQHGLAMPTAAELIGVVLLIGALVLLSLAPRLTAHKSAAA